MASDANLETGGTADQYMPKFDLTDIGATLAAGPSHDSVVGRTRHHVHDRSPSPRSSSQRHRSPRPERQEHVKRTRISYDGLGRQEPNMSPSTCIWSTQFPHGKATLSDETPDTELLRLGLPVGSRLDATPGIDVEVPQPSLFGKLCGRMARLLLGS